MRLGVIALLMSEPGLAPWVVVALGCYQPTFDGAVTPDGEVRDDAAPPGDGAPDAAADAALCAPATNDRRDFAIDVSVGGRFCVELGEATDDIDSSCSATGGRDLFFDVDLPASEIVYVDTLGSNVGVVLALFPGPCATSQPEIGCRSASCAQGVQLAEDLPAGPTCLVIDEAPGSSGSGQVVLNVVRGGAWGPQRLPASGGSIDASNTCSQGNAVESEGCLLQSFGPDLRAYFTLCPGEVRTLSARVTTCTPATGVYHLYGVSGPIGGSQVGCSIVSCEDSTADVILPFASAGLNWLVLDGRTASDCGALGLTVTF